MAVNLSLLAGAGAQFFTNSGVPLAGGLLYTYNAGTTTPAATYTSNTGVTPNSNPIVLDSAGRVIEEIWLTTGSTYKFILKDSTFVQIWSKDNIPGANDPTALNDFKAELANTANSALGDALVGFRQSDSSGNLPGSVGRTVHQKLQETVSVKDFGAVGDGVTDDTTAIQVALNSGATRIVFPQGTYYTDTLVTFSGQTLDLTGATLKLIPHATSHNPVIRIGTVSTAVNHVTIIGGTIDGNQLAQTYPLEEWSPAVLIWGSDYNKVIGTIATNCAGDGITVGYDSDRVVGSNGNTVENCEVYNNYRQGIALTWGNENQILNNRVSGTIDLEINAGIGECKNNLVNGNTGRTQTESLTAPRITDMQISLASLSTSMTAYYGNIITNNHCFLIQSQYNNSTIIANNLIVGSNNTQTFLIDLAASDSCNVKDNILIANTVVATALLGLIRTRACSYLSVTNNEALNDTLAFHFYSSANFGAQTAITGTHYFYGNMLAGTGKYRSGTVLNPSEFARIRVDQINGTGVSYTQIDGVPLTFGVIGIATANLTFSNIGGAGATWIMNIDAGCNNTTSGAGNGNNATGLFSYTEAGSGKTITAFTATIAAGSLSYSAFSFAVSGGTGSFYVNFWY